ncbi:hypothetical protein KTO58_26930 [Chitinophaga pendula]|uniref:hypothetical protein n=1 Tax=Chitinophaga TaxID=79328 RepID=UPI000BAEF378|nr:MULTISPECIES: hypothetical protein [Chitinophaga]ASZ09807.1 hypothetical protein CK934_01835 [Chitinophaga sp. MD30]UCJ07253.1 hypothetical protein KTO58_26930 [Chitinophaga pendula]
MPLLLAFLGAGLFFFFLVQLVADFRSLSELRTLLPYDRDWRHHVAPWMVLPALAMIFVFGMHAAARERRALQSQQVKVQGVVTAAAASTQKGSYVTVLFTTVGGKQMKVMTSLRHDITEVICVGQAVDLLYNVDDPAQVRLLTE